MCVGEKTSHSHLNKLGFQRVVRGGTRGESQRGGVKRRGVNWGGVRAGAGKVLLTFPAPTGPTTARNGVAEVTSKLMSLRTLLSLSWLQEAPRWPTLIRGSPVIPFGMAPSASSPTPSHTRGTCTSLDELERWQVTYGCSPWQPDTSSNSSSF